ncbi:MAG TPA: 50S ribosomal protein L21 [Flavobacteriales bacterium]|nr:50S ribosomal protein L21 [Flavobacteriales bacterium]
MYAIVEIAGQQFKVEKDQQIFVHRLDGKEGDQVSFNQVLLIENDGKIAVGAPAVADAAVTGKIIEHLRGDKVHVFKKKRRKGYQKRNGHRQDLTKIMIESILEKGGSKISKAKTEAPKAEAKAPVAEKKAAPKAETPKAAAPKASAPKASAPKAASAKKAEPKAKSAAAPVKKTAAKSTTAKKAAPKTAAKSTKSATAKKAEPKKDTKK